MVNGEMDLPIKRVKLIFFLLAEIVVRNLPNKDRKIGESRPIKVDTSYLFFIRA